MLLNTLTVCLCTTCLDCWSRGQLCPRNEWPVQPVSGGPRLWGWHFLEFLLLHGEILQGLQGWWSAQKNRWVYGYNVVKMRFVRKCYSKKDLRPLVVKKRGHWKLLSRIIIPVHATNFHSIYWYILFGVFSCCVLDWLVYSKTWDVQIWFWKKSHNTGSKKINRSWTH